MLYETILDGDALSLLKEYCSHQFLQSFSLARGTGLALRLGHRISYDLDLFSYENLMLIILMLNLSHTMAWNTLKEELFLMLYFLL